MSDVAEGIGGALEGALAGRAVEPKHGETAGDHRAEACANCGAVGTSTYCPECGQKRHVHRTLAAIGHDLLHGVLHLDGKFWSTLPLLVFKPGQLTRRYIEGERAKFVSPMAMFLFTVFAMFAIFQVVGLTVPSEIEGGSNLNAATERMIAETEESLEEKRERAAEFDQDSLDFENAQEEIAAMERGLAGLKEAEVLNFKETQTVNLETTGWDFIDNGLAKKWNDNPGLMVYKLQANAYKFSWLLIPLSIPFVWLLFAWKRRFKAYDHAVFVTYSLSFMSMLFVTASLVLALTGWVPVGVFMMLLVPPLHIYKQLRGTYELGRFGAFWRLLAISIFIWIVVALFLQLLLVLGAF